MKRIEEIDIIKGLSIFGVVLGHTRFWGTHFIYLFHMAAFFIASGYCYKSCASDSFKNVCTFVIKRIKRLWLPFVIWNTIFSLFHNIFINISIYTDNASISDYLDASLVSISKVWSAEEMLTNIVKGLFFAGHTELGGAFWFLRILFYICVAYVIVDFLLKLFLKNEKILLIVQGFVSAIFLTIGFIMGQEDIDLFAIDRALTCYCLYYLGILLSRITLKECKVIVDLGTAICSGGLLCEVGLYGSIDLGNNEYENPLFLIVVSLLGWVMLVGFARVINRVSIIKSFFVFLGQNSIFVVIFHFLSFKLVNLFIAVIKNIPLFTIAGFPVAFSDGWWWILYTAFGVGIPLLISCFWRKIKKYISTL